MKLFNKYLLFILKFFYQENKEDDLHMKMQIIFLAFPTLPTRCPNQFFFQNCLMNTQLRAAFLFPFPAAYDATAFITVSLLYQSDHDAKRKTVIHIGEDEERAWNKTDVLAAWNVYWHLHWRLYDAQSLSCQCLRQTVCCTTSINPRRRVFMPYRRRIIPCIHRIFPVI